MTRIVVRNLILSAFLAFSICLVWVFNQKINYRKVLSFDQSLLLKSGKENSSNISSVYYIFSAFKKAGLNVTLQPNVETSSEFSVIGRILRVNNSDIYIYEYSSEKYALKDFQKNKDLYISSIFIYKNLVIHTKDENNKVMEILGSLTK